MDGEALWDDYGYHHDDIVEAPSMVPRRRRPAEPAPARSAPAEPAPVTEPLRPR
jgi:hypothetical protein